MKNISRATIIISLIALFSGLGLGWILFGTNANSDHDHETAIENSNLLWTCSMHPHIRLKQAGQCPVCGMDLIPLAGEESEENPMAIKMSPTAMQLANVQTSIITKQQAIKEVRLNGKVKADERYVFSQTSHITGRIEKLLVNYTGEYIRKGQVLAHIYSPELVSAQEELFEAYKVRESQSNLYKATRSKLKNWKLTEEQIDGIIKSGSIREDFPILSDLTGVVLTKRVNLGDHIKEGSSLFEVANLSKVWVLFDVYETDMVWVKLGDQIEFSIQSIPGEKFEGKINFIDPVINPKTRVVNARVLMNNPDLRLKPEMFVQGILKSQLEDKDESIVIPKSAVMWTGERSVVYIKPEHAGNSFMMKEVLLGPSLGKSYIILDGLEEGDEIATNGTFSIDAAAQLAGKPSMMNPEGGVEGMPKMPGMKMDDVEKK